MDVKLKFFNLNWQAEKILTDKYTGTQMDLIAF